MVRAGGIDLVDVDILLIGAEDRLAEGGMAVVAHGHAGRRGFARADHVEAGRSQMHNVTQARDRMVAMGVAGEDRPSRGAAARRDDPIVGAREVSRHDDFGELVDLSPFRSVGQGGGETRFGEGHCGGRELEKIEHGERDLIERQTCRIAWNNRWLKVLAQEIIGVTGLAEHVGAQHLGQRVSRQRVAADAHDVLRAPALRPRTRQAEFDRQTRGLQFAQIDVGVDAFDEGFGDRLRVRRVGFPFHGHVAAIEEGARGLILREIAGAEMGR
jgi:hypothetical protein